MLFFALNGSDDLGRKIAAAGGFQVALHEEREFDGGEHKTRPLTSVRGKDVYVLHSLNGTSDASANDKLCRLLFFIATCKENGAARVTAVVPYLAYSRKDRQTKARDPVTTKYVAALFEAAGTDMIITLDAHTVIAYQNAYRCQSIHVDPNRLFAESLVAAMNSERYAVLSPDAGGIKRAQLFQETLETSAGRDIAFAMMEKRRSGGVVSGSLFAGDVDGRTVYVVDDMIVGGETVKRAARTCLENGARDVHVVATHALFGANGAENPVGDDIGRLFVTDSIEMPDHVAAALGSRLQIVSVAPLLGAVINRSHSSAYAS
ncbi:ribose-phosphate diphosphokinase [Hoeflea sp. TYP-13]|uniref:ribose-phosphate diphosphokinase n=1 Tax=Hoeflea sp. TYP-13 TaxID=3230023 RepID=UPI0034C69416